MSFQPYSQDRSLQDPLPRSPLETFGRWLHEAEEQKVRERWDSFTLATVTPEGRPDGRVLLCKGYDGEAGWLVFYTNLSSPKSRDLESHPYGTAVFHWDRMTRQARLSGPVLRSPGSESDAYWATRPRISQLSAWASAQSETVESRDAFLQSYAVQEERFGGPEGPPVPRPPHWGGYRLWFERVELWVAGDGRIHDRGLWTRELTPAGGAYETSAWTVARLQP